MRLKSFDYSLPYAYFITIRCFDGKEFFKDIRLARDVIECLMELKSKFDMKIFAYCFMPDHIHLLLSPKENQISVPKFLQMFKGKATHIYWKIGFEGRLWQRSYYDHVLRSYEDTHEVVKYILFNPVRKEIVTDMFEYPFSGVVDELPCV